MTRTPSPDARPASASMNQLIDHTYLAPGATLERISQLCREAIEHEFRAVCIPPFFVARASSILEGSKVKLATVIAYPYGYAETPIKVAEARRALDEGADELDIVNNLSAVKSGDWNYVRSDIEQMVTTLRLKSKVGKFILEAGSLTEGELHRLINICNELRPNFVKTSTGIDGGATVEQVRLLRANLHPEIKIKASGGIRTAAQARELIEAGADRIGSSSALELIR